MSEEERLDIIEGTDEDGNRVLLVVEKYFYYNGDEYVLLRPQDEAELPEDKATRYVMRVRVMEEDGEEIEEFEPVDEALAQRLIPVIKAQWQGGLDG
ncbi:MAG: DUF1292 domain-containing protein [Eubacteriales bacterium]|jgi:uncharacterized protein YrzB (UPF0473 family)|nr:DUF1292 domain-containing protein [Eubacteriales bacterium]MDD3572529.1 DUF1292 domain-containing protein [Eubacteriales bacterium]MDD4134742.1 DUF1292 domain-containing protein [Eubacteriales bacterium]NLO13746.1 DUF1292 domain-containing protein [Clostridiales bacterium]